MFLSVSNGDRLEDIPCDVDLITMGINPSKSRLHEGHYLTLYQVLKLMEVRKKLVARVFVDDREFDTRKYSLDTTKLYIPPDEIVGRLERLILEFSHTVAASMGQNGTMTNRLSIQRMSEYMTEPGVKHANNGFALFRNIWDNAGKVKREFDGFSTRQDRQSAFRPACSECTHATLQSKKIMLCADGMEGECINEECDCHSYNVNIQNGANGWFIHYALDPLRDIDLARSNNAGVVHIFGGDYGVKWGVGGRPKAERLSHLIPEIDNSVTIHHFVGPMLTRNGVKLSKSKGDAADAPSVDELEYILSNNDSVIEYSPH